VTTEPVGLRVLVIDDERPALDELVFLLDSDLEEQPEWLDEFHREMERHRADVVYGVQETRKGGIFERLTGAIFYATFNAMLELPLQHREIIALCDLEELPYTTVAGILDCPVGTVRSRLHRARALLTIRLASLELIDLESEPPIAYRGLS